MQLCLQISSNNLIVGLDQQDLQRTFKAKR